MKRAARCLRAAVVALSLGCAACGTSARPNVLLIVVDTLRADHLGAYGYGRPTSPRIDALASEGVRFERAYSAAPWTRPAVASLLSGLQPGRHGALGVSHVLPDSVDTLAEILKRDGYATAAIVSHDVISARSGFAQGFDLYDEANAGGADHVSTPGVTDAAVRLLEQLKSDAPFLLLVHYFDPHNTYLRHPTSGFAPPKAGRFEDGPSIRELRALLRELTEEELAFVVDLYDDEVRFTDAGVGRVLDALRDLGLEDHTLVALTADHGEEFLERGWIGHTRSLHDELLRVPLIVRDPRGGARGRSEPVPVSTTSLTPTLLDLAGIDPRPFGFSSPSLAEAVRGVGSPTPAPVYAEVDYRPTARELPIKRTQKRAVVDGRFKLVRDELAGELALYDLFADPGERENLAPARPELASRLSRVLAEHAAAESAAARPEATRSLSREEIERLRELGYLEPAP